MEGAVRTPQSLANTQALGYNHMSANKFEHLSLLTEMIKSSLVHDLHPIVYFENLRVAALATPPDPTVTGSSSV